jgi:hypothetical protein
VRGGWSDLRRARKGGEDMRVRGTESRGGGSPRNMWHGRYLGLFPRNARLSNFIHALCFDFLETAMTLSSII